MTARRGPLQGREHERARDLASMRLDEALAVADASWLDGHLAACEDCSGVAAEYADGRLAFAGLRANPAEPPRDLWARTAAKIEVEASRRPNRAPAPRRMLGGRVPMGALAPLTAVLVVAVAVGAGLLNGTSLVPSGTSPLPTPIAITAAADVQVLSRGEDGTVQILSRPVNAVCPEGSSQCGLTRTFAVTNVGGVSGGGSLNAVMSPHRDRLVVVATSNGTQGVFVLPVAAPEAVPTASGSASATDTSGASGGGTASLLPSGPVVIATSSPSGLDSSASPDASPSIPVSPAPNGVLQIASNVVVVGSAAYSPDGMQVAFSARPADGSVGPDVYLWTSGEAVARALTSDHAAQFASWTTAGILVSRVADGTPSTTLLEPATGAETPVALGAAWLPVVDPTGTMGAWWSGTVKLDHTGAWVPDHGKLVVGPWPKDAGAGAVPPSPSPDPSPTPDVPGSAEPASAAPTASAVGSSGAPASADATSAPAASSTASPAATSAASPSATPSVGVSASPSSSATSASVSPSAAPSISASPSAAPDGVQVLARGPLLAWAVRWDETGTAMAVWTFGADEAAATPSGIVGSPAATASPVAPDGTRFSANATPTGLLPDESPATGTPAASRGASPAATPVGRLSLYRVDLATGAADLAHPMLDAAPADGGFSLRTGRLAWTSRSSGELVLQVLAWSGATIGRLELPAATGAMIVP